MIIICLNLTVKVSYNFTIRKIFRKLLVPSPGPGDNVLQTFLKEYTPSAYGGAKIAYLEFEYVITKADGGQYWRNGQYYIYPQYDNDIGGAGTNGRSNLWSNTPTNPEIDTSKLNETLDFEFAVDDVAFIVFTGRAIYTDFTEGEDFQVPLAEEDSGDVLVPENNLEDEFTLE